MKIHDLNANEWKNITLGQSLAGLTIGGVLLDEFDAKWLMKFFRIEGGEEEATGDDVRRLSWFKEVFLPRVAKCLPPDKHTAPPYGPGQAAHEAYQSSAENYPSEKTLREHIKTLHRNVAENEAVCNPPNALDAKTLTLTIKVDITDPQLLADCREAIVKQIMARLQHGNSLL